MGRQSPPVEIGTESDEKSFSSIAMIADVSSVCVCALHKSTTAAHIVRQYANIRFSLQFFITF